MSNQIKQNVLLEDIQTQISEAWSSIHKFQSLSYCFNSNEDYLSEEYDMEDMVFKSKLKRIYISICLLLESLGYLSLLNDFKSEFKKFEGNKITSLSILPWIGDFHSDSLDCLWLYYRTLSSLLGHDVENEDKRIKRELFESILRNTPKIVYDRGIDPENETDVKKCIHDLLIHIFPDTVREIPIVKITKTYKPDLGIKSLGTAVEYKYADTEQEVKTAIGGFYADMHGYTGDKNWEYFYAVMYMTQPFFTEQQIQAEFSIAEVKSNWRLILVHGNGTRKTKSKPSSTQ